MKVGGSRDLIAGLVLILFAAALFWFGRNLAIGQATRLGPGYLPRVLAGLISLLGIIISTRALRCPGVPIGSANPVAIGFVLAAILLFGLLLERLGLAAAGVLMLLTASFAAPGFRPVQAVPFAVALTAFAIAVFSWGLGMNVRVLPW